MRTLLFLFAAALPLILRRVGLVLPEPLATLLCGWWDRAARALPRADADLGGIATGVVCVGLLVVLLHHALAWFRPAQTTPWRWTFALTASVALMFVAGLFGVGLFRTLLWLAQSHESLLR